MIADNERWRMFESAIRLHHADLHAFAYRVLGEKEQAEDALQSAYVKAFRAVRAGSLGSTVNRPWLFRVVYHCCIDEFRSSARTKHDTVDELALAVEADDEELGSSRARFRERSSSCRRLLAGSTSCPRARTELRRGSHGARRAARHHRLAAQPRQRRSPRSAARVRTKLEASMTSEQGTPGDNNLGKAIGSIPLPALRVAFFSPWQRPPWTARH